MTQIFELIFTAEAEVTHAEPQTTVAVEADEQETEKD